MEKKVRILLSHGPIGISKEPERLEYVSRGPNRLLCLLVGSENTKWAESERVISPFTLSMPTYGYPMSHELILNLEWYPTPLEQATYRYGPILTYPKRIWHLDQSIPCYGHSFLSLKCV